MHCRPAVLQFHCSSLTHSLFSLWSIARGPLRAWQSAHCRKGGGLPRRVGGISAGKYYLHRELLFTWSAGGVYRDGVGAYLRWKILFTWVIIVNPECRRGLPRRCWCLFALENIIYVGNYCLPGVQEGFTETVLALANKCKADVNTVNKNGCTPGE